MESPPKDIDLDFRPDTYWPKSLTPDQLISRIRGKVRQDMARQVFSEKGFTGLSEFIAREELGEEDRAAWGAIHPMFMGGEYLPPSDDGEVEIVRISLRSVTGDQISVRAKREGETVKYRVVSEYEDDEDMHYLQPFYESNGPLTLGRLVSLIDGSEIPGDIYSGGLVVASWNAGYDGSGKVDDSINFVSIDSPFYPELKTYYETLSIGWREQNTDPDDDDDDDDDDES